MQLQLQEILWNFYSELLLRTNAEGPYSLIVGRMAVKISYFTITSAIFLVLLLLLDHLNLYQALEEDSQCRFLDDDLSNNSVNVGGGVGFESIKNSCGGCGCRSSPISPKQMNPLVVMASRVVLNGRVVALFIYLCCKHTKSIQFHLTVMESVVGPSPIEDLEEYDIMSRRRIRSGGNHQPKVC